MAVCDTVCLSISPSTHSYYFIFFSVACVLFCFGVCVWGGCIFFFFWGGGCLNFFESFFLLLCGFEFYYFVFNIHSVIHTICFVYLGEV